MKTKDRVMDVKSYQTVTKVRLVKEPTELPKTKINSSMEAYELALQFYDGDIEIVESFYCIYLNRANKVTSFSEISSGGTCATVVDPKIIFNQAFQLLAQALILVHNHPSGNIKPSDQDKALTEKIKNIAKLHEVTLLDHIIVTPDAYFSFSDSGLI